MEYRMATKADMEQFFEHRIEFATSVKQIDQLEEYRRRTKEFLNQHIEQDDLVIFLAVEDNKIIASCMAFIWVTPPFPSCLTGVTAEVLNVYTIAQYRHQGHCKKLLQLLLDELKKRNVEKVLLEYTDAGHPVYQKLGFKELDRQMVLKLK